MLTGNEDPAFRSERARLAAERSGHACAMLANLFLAKSAPPGKLDVWSEEQRVWQKRREKLGLGLGPDSHRELGQVSAAAFMAAQIDKIPRSTI